LSSTGEGVVREGVVEKPENIVLKEICMPSSSSTLNVADLDSSGEEAEIVESEEGKEEAEEEARAESAGQDYRPFLFWRV